MAAVFVKIYTRMNLCGRFHIHYLYNLTNHLVLYFREDFIVSADQKQELPMPWQPCVIKRKLCQDLTNIVPAKFGSDWPSSFRSNCGILTTRQKSKLLLNRGDHYKVLKKNHIQCQALHKFHFWQVWFNSQGLCASEKKKK